jgi:5-methylcytosine-specific restriction endonuclease McrA
VDHIIPVSKGGHPSDLSNLQLAHRCCNRQKSDRLLPSPAVVDSEDKPIANNVLEQHMVWANYRSK